MVGCDEFKFGNTKKVSPLVQSKLLTKPTYLEQNSEQSDSVPEPVFLSRKNSMISLIKYCLRQNHSLFHPKLNT